jgi:hypothetical protein
MGVPGDCRPFHSETVIDGQDELRIFRCDWGWCVKRGDDAYRSRTLVDALEQMSHGRPLEQTLLRDVVGAIQRALEAEHTRTGRTSSAVIARDALLTSPEALPPG